MSSIPPVKSRRSRRPAADSSQLGLRSSRRAAEQIRPLTRADLQLEIDFLLGLSSESLYQRVMGTVRLRSTQRVEELLTYDAGPSMVLGVIDGKGLPGEPRPSARLLGVARYAPTQTPGVAEMAVIVADDQHGRGLARRLLEHLHEIAGASGYREMTALAFANNQPMLGLAQRLGYQRSSEPGDGAVVRLRKDLHLGGIDDSDGSETDASSGHSGLTGSKRRTAVRTPRISSAIPAAVPMPGHWPRNR